MVYIKRFRSQGFVFQAIKLHAGNKVEAAATQGRGGDVSRGWFRGPG